MAPCFWVTDVIPEVLRRPILRLAHEGHPGLEAFQDTLRTRVWWSGLTKDVNLFAERCDVHYVDDQIILNSYSRPNRKVSGTNWELTW